ncbi:MAG: hypothetical protein J5626_01700 [Lachnospiraceae bacterium]|nr:hypothetical protein [Lachnospiraceae bacterium]
MNSTRLLGICAGVIVGIAIVALVATLIKKVGNTNESFKAEYDERQNAARGKAFGYAFYAMLIAVGIELVYHVAFPTGFLTLNPMYFDIGALFFGLLVYASVSIWKNAYIGINQTFKRSTILLLLIAAFNIAIGLINHESGSASGYVNILLGVLIIIICIEMAIKQYIDSKNSDDDSDEE